MSSPITQPYVSYFGDGTIKDFNVPFSRLSDSYVTVDVDGASQSYTWVNTSKIRLAPAPAAGAFVEIYRNTPESALATFRDNTATSADKFNLGLRQAIHHAQERLDQKLQRVLRADPTDVAYPVLPLPTANARANKALSFDADGNPVVGVAATPAALAALQGSVDALVAGVVPGGILQAGNVAAIRALTAPYTPTTVHLLSYETGKLNGGGWFELASGSVAADDGVEIFVDTVGRRWKRQLRGREITLQMAGCVGDGVADDTVAFNRAIAWLNISNFRTILGLPGTYRLSAKPTPITRSDVSMIGAGVNACRLVMDASALTNGTVWELSASSRVVIDGWSVTFESPTTATHVFEVNGGGDIYISNLNFTASAGVARVGETSNTSRISFDRVCVTNPKFSANISQYLLREYKTCRIRHNHIVGGEAGTAFGIHVQAKANCDGLYISDSDIWSSAMLPSAIVLDGSNGQVVNIDIERNVLDHTYDKAIRIVNTGAEDVHHIRIRDNRIFNDEGYGIHVLFSGTEIGTDLQILGNLLATTYEAAIFTGGTVDLIKNALICGNTILHVQGPGGTPTLSALVQMSHGKFVLSSNIFGTQNNSDAADFAYCVQILEDVDNFSITGNIGGQIAETAFCKHFDYVTGGKNIQVVGNGSKTGNVQVITANSNQNLTPYSSSDTLVSTATLTADRSWTLLNTGAYHGQIKEILHRGSGAFNIKVRDAAAALLKDIPLNGSGRFVYLVGTGWVLLA